MRGELETVSIFLIREANNWWSNETYLLNFGDDNTNHVSEWRSCARILCTVARWSSSSMNLYCYSCSDVDHDMLDLYQANATVMTSMIVASDEVVTPFRWDARCCELSQNVSKKTRLLSIDASVCTQDRVPVVIHAFVNTYCTLLRWMTCTSLTHTCELCNT